MSEVKKVVNQAMKDLMAAPLTDDQKLAASLFVTIYPHKLAMLQRELDAVSESERFAKMVLQRIKENF